jgi:hypothetical protein
VPILPVAVVNTDVVGENLKRLRRTRLEVHVGQPYQLPQMERRVKGPELEAYTHLIMVKIAGLLPERYHGFYKESPALKALLEGRDPWPHCLEVARSAPATAPNGAAAPAVDSQGGPAA